MSIPMRIAATVLIATLMAMIGAAMIGFWDSLNVILPISIGLWLLLAIPLSGLPFLAGAYFGVLSPLIACLVFPLGIIVVVAYLQEFCFIGMVTGLLVSAVWRYGRYDDLFELYP